MNTTVRRLTDSERATYAASTRAAGRCQARVHAGEVQCDRCDRAALVMSVSAGAMNCLCRACYPTFHVEAVEVARAAAWH